MKSKGEMIKEIRQTLNCPLYIVDCLYKLNANDLEGLHYHTIRDCRTGRKR